MNIKYFLEQDLKASEDLRDQYQKEYFDATYQRGLCAGMKTYDRLAIACDLSNRIEDLNKYISSLKKQIKSMRYKEKYYGN